MRKILLLAPVLLLTLAACGGGSRAASGGRAGTSTGGSSRAPLRVGDTSLGRVLVDRRGHTVYLLTADTPGHSGCGAQCLSYWPAVPVTSTPHHLAGVSAVIATAALPGGGRTLSASGWPLYTFVEDAAPGDVHGEGKVRFGGTWWAVSPAGQPVRTPSPRSSSSTTGGTTRGGY